MASLTVTPQCGPTTSTTSRKASITTALQSARARIQLTESYSYCDFYVGAVDDFIVAGFFTREQCPGQPGNPKTTSSFYCGVRRSPGAPRCPKDEGFMTIQLTGRHRARVQVGLENEEAQRRAAERKRRLAADKDAEGSRKALEDMPSTHAAFRARTAATMQAVLLMIPRAIAPTVWHGFSYDDETKAEIAELTDEIVALLQRGGTCFNRERHMEIATGYRASIARADITFAGVLSKLSTLSERAEEVTQ
ncbi:hypothetical protein RCH10_003795 [Variovorax sp. GrIS 2.14]|uniref:hypothetical protein n=1 Tax=Variovorax sp. GrIS 2.14 TaxID=3071709 RepID=UPI0038F68AA9